jgi:hypothetical protein
MRPDSKCCLLGAVFLALVGVFLPALLSQIDQDPTVQSSILASKMTSAGSQCFFPNCDGQDDTRWDLIFNNCHPMSSRVLF